MTRTHPLSPQDIRSMFRDPGCILDGLHGQAANDARLVTLAIECGWDGSPGTGEDEAEDALKFLNTHVLPADRHLEWDEGHLMLTVTGNTAD